MATDQVFIYTMNQGGTQGGSWSRYIFPFTIEHYAHLANDLYLRAEDTVHRVIEGGLNDNGVNFEGVIQWPWLDFGAPGVNKMMEGFDIVGEGTSSIEVGYDQTALGTFTTKYPIPVDTYPGQLIPMAVNAPTMSVRLTYDGGQAWQWNALSLYLLDQRVGS